MGVSCIVWVCWIQVEVVEVEERCCLFVESCEGRLGLGGVRKFVS